MLADELGQPIVDLRPHLARHHRLERRRRHLQRQIAAARRDRCRRWCSACASRVARRAPADQKSRHLLDRLLRRRQADAGQRAAGERLQPLERQRQMRAALVARDGVNLIDDHGAAGRQHLAARDSSRARCTATRAWSRRCAAAVRRIAARSRLRRVAGAHHGANRHSGSPSAASSSRCPRAAPRDCAECRSTAPSAARRRRCASHPATRPSSPSLTS